LCVTLMTCDVFCVPVTHSLNDWGVIYPSTHICALKGSRVEILCTYAYPLRKDGRNTTVEETFWFSKQSPFSYVDLRTDPDYSGRVQYHRGNNDCTLRITDLRKSDSAVYKFRFTTNQSGGKYTGLPGVTLSVAGNIFTGSQLESTYRTHFYDTELTCHSNDQQADTPSYIWYKNGVKVTEEKRYFHLQTFGRSDRYYCAAKGQKCFRSPAVYAPKPPSVSVSPSAEIVEGSSVTLNCSSDANPAANYTWYKENGNPLSKESQFYFSSIRPSESGEFYCTAENELGRNSKRITIDVKYAPRLPSVSVSPSAEIVEGSSVTLTCSSDANPAANYTWYKENQPLLRGPGGKYHFTSISSKDRGIYYCKAENQYGHINSISLFLHIQCESHFHFLILQFFQVLHCRERTAASRTRGTVPLHLHQLQRQRDLLLQG
uniref:B-cell receptor CD22 n=1 Tax=Stegastes partitus TaxID=144197 RepID=A0A3B5AP62_9TELE